MSAVAGIDHGNIEMTRDKVCSARSGVAHNQAIGLHGVEVERGVEKRFAFFQAARFGLQIHGVRAKTRSSGAEAEARARGILEKRERNGFAAERGQFFEWMALNGLERFALIEEKGKFIRRKRFQCEQVAEAVRQTILRPSSGRLLG